MASEKQVRRGYCKIRTCINFKGSENPGERFVAVPRNGEYREKWISAIEEHQPFDYSFPMYFLCSRHFDSSCRKEGEKTRWLRTWAIPTIFDAPDANSFTSPSATNTTKTLSTMAVTKASKFYTPRKLDQIVVGKNVVKESVKQQSNKYIFHQTPLRLRYCKIKSCVNFRGTQDENLNFFIIPNRGEDREKWIHAIEQHQTFDSTCTRYFVCSLHFEPQCYTTFPEIMRGKKIRLKKGSVPTIFDAHSTSTATNAQSEVLNTTARKRKPEDIALITTADDELFESKFAKQPKIKQYGQRKAVTEIEIPEIEPKIEEEEDDGDYKGNTVENVYDGPQTCYICNSSSEFYCRNLYETKSTHTETRIRDYITKWLNNIPPSRKIRIRDDHCICVDCLDKINEFDLMYVTAKQMEKEMIDVFLQTESLLKEVKVELVDENHADHLAQEKVFSLDPFTGELVESYEESMEMQDISETNDLLVCTGSDENRIVELKTEPETEEQNVKPNSQPATERKSKHNKNNIVKVRYYYRCVLCKKVLDSAEALKTHEHSPSNFKLVSDTNKTIKLATVEKKKKPEPEVNATAKKKFVECQQCPCQLPVHELEKHMLAHEMNRKVNIYKYRCKVCAFDLTDEQTLSEHVALHEGKDPLQCVFCPRIAKNRNYLRHHMHFCHSGKLFYLCHICGKSFIRHAKYSLHMNQAHSTRPPKRVECEICKKTFADRRIMRIHRFKHSGIKKHECPDCHKKFSLGTEMRVHQRIHDKTGAYKKHICSVCDKRFIKNHLLKKHLEKEHGVMEFRETMEPLV